MSEVISILGTGFSSLSSACSLSREGQDVTINKKNTTFCDRATPRPGIPTALISEIMSTEHLAS